MKEALKLALEALKEAQTNDDGMEKWDRNKKAITAIKAALAQPADHSEQNLDMVKAQPAQEPVAWMRPSKDGYDSAFRDHSTVVRCTGNPWAGWVPLYTTPPQEQQSCDRRTWGKPWVSLTDEEISECYEATYEYGMSMNDLPQIIEAKLKAKNGFPQEEKNT